MASDKRKLPDSDVEPSSSSRHTRRRTENAELAFPNPFPTSAPPSPPFQQPVSLLTFSYVSPPATSTQTDSRVDATTDDPSRHLQFDNAGLKYFSSPPPAADLGYGYERWIKRPDERGRLDPLLRAWSRVKGTAAGDAGIGIVSWRGVMTRILTSPYEERDSFELNVMAIGKTMFFEEHSSDDKLKDKNTMEDYHRLQSYYGYAFESYCTSETPVPQPSASNQDHPLGWSSDVNTNHQWCSVVKTKLGDTRMVIGGEVDCVRGLYKQGSTSNFVELKTSMVIRGAADEARFEKKLLKFYFQSFLLGVPEIYVGFRSKQGIVQTTQSFETMKIPRLVRSKPGAWEPSVCLSWGSDFIHFLKRIVVLGSDAEHHPRVYRVKFTPKAGVSVQVLDEAGVQEVENGEQRVGFLPKWFWDEETRSRESVDTKPEVPRYVPTGWKI